MHQREASASNSLCHRNSRRRILANRIHNRYAEAREANRPVIGEIIQARLASATRHLDREIAEFRLMRLVYGLSPPILGQNLIAVRALDGVEVCTVIDELDIVADDDLEDYLADAR